MNYLEKLQKEKEHLEDLIIKPIKYQDKTFYIISIETLSSSSDINDSILYYFSYKDYLPKYNLTDYLYHTLPVISIQKVNNYDTLLNLLFNGFTILIINDDILAIETELIYQEESVKLIMKKL